MVVVAAVLVVAVVDVHVYIGRNLLGEVQPLLQSRSRRLDELMDEYGLEDLPETEEPWEVPEPKVIMPLKPSTLLTYCSVTIGKESVPKIIINNAINVFFKPAISILVISNRNSFRVLFDRIPSVYFICKNIFIF